MQVDEWKLFSAITAMVGTLVGIVWKGGRTARQIEVLHEADKSLEEKLQASETRLVHRIDGIEEKLTKQEDRTIAISENVISIKKDIEWLVKTQQGQKKE